MMTMIWFRVIAIAIVVLAVGFSVNRVVTWKKASDALPQVKAEAEQKVRSARKEVEMIRNQFLTAYDASKVYQDELKKLRDAPRPPPPVIRVCKSAAAVRPATPSAAATGPDATAPATGVLQETVRFDTGPLYRDADRCDELSAQIRGLHEFEIAEVEKRNTP